MPSDTATPEGARDHARSQAGTVAEHMPTLPATAYAAGAGRRRRRRPGVGRAGGRRRLHPPGGARPAPRSGSPTSTATPVPTCCCTTPTSRGSGSTWPTRSRSSGNAYLGVGQLLLSDQGRVLATHRGRHRRPPRHAVRHLEPAPQRDPVRLRGGPRPEPGRPRAVPARRGQARARARRRPAEHLVLQGRPRRARLRRTSTWTGAAPARPTSSCGPSSTVLVLGRQHRPRARPPPGLVVHTLEVLAWRGRADRARTGGRPPRSPEAAAGVRQQREDLAARASPMSVSRPPMPTSVDTVRGPGAVVGGRARRRSTLRIVDLERQPGRRLPLLRRRTTPPSATAPPRPWPWQGTSSSPPGSVLRSHRRPSPADDRRRHDVGRHDTIGGACSQGVEHPALRPPHHAPARLRRELPGRGVALGPRQARPRQQHQLVHERAGRGGRHPGHRRRHLRPGPVGDAAGPHGTSSC